jgi:ribulose-phosphate 3-epimerase
MEPLRKCARKPLDVHLMITHPEKYVERFCDAGAWSVGFHLEAVASDEVSDILSLIRAKGVRTCLTINPDIPAEGLLPHLAEVDMVLVMSVFAGFGGQKFIPESLEKVRFLRQEINRRGLPTLIEVDGGVNMETGKLLKEAGADVLVAGNAIFRSGGGMAGVSGQDIYGIVYEKIDFISDKAVEGADYAVAVNHDKGWGGRQVFNINGYGATISNLTFKSCSFTGYRAVVRSQKDGDNITNLLLEDCVINAIGDQGVVTTTNKKGDWRNVTLRNCTITNIVMLCDFRASVDKINFNIEDCTFCYAPLETTANSNAPMFRLGTNNVVLKVKNSVFGPSMASGSYDAESGTFNATSEGGDIQPYQAGTAGSIFLTGTPDNMDVENSFKTDFTWIDLNTTGEGDPKIFPLEGLGELGISESALWKNPTQGIFNIIGKVSGVDLSKVGDARWQ